MILFIEDYLFNWIDSPHETIKLIIILCLTYCQPKLLNLIHN